MKEKAASDLSLGTLFFVLFFVFVFIVSRLEEEEEKKKKKFLRRKKNIWHNCRSSFVRVRSLYMKLGSPETTFLKLTRCLPTEGGVEWVDK